MEIPEIMDKPISAIHIVNFFLVKPCLLVIPGGLLYLSDYWAMLSNWTWLGLGGLALACVYAIELKMRFFRAKYEPFSGAKLDDPTIDHLARYLRLRYKRVELWLNGITGEKIRAVENDKFFIDAMSDPVTVKVVSELIFPRSVLAWYSMHQAIAEELRGVRFRRVR